MVGNLSVVGLGLIGGSVALGARERGLARRITAFDTRPEMLEQARAAGVVDRAATSLKSAVRGADLIILAVPVLSIAPLAMEAHALAPRTAVITDVGSTKGTVTAALAALPRGGPAFVGGHPIAGTENSGFAAARGDLFEGAPFILTPTPRTGKRAAALVERFWTGLGSRVYRLSPAEHDRLFALISHLPHLVAYALVGAVYGGVGDAEAIARFSGGGFRDYTRIAASDPVMWRDICLDNREQILHALGLLENELAYIREVLSGGQGDTLRAIFEKSRTLKRSL